MTLGSVSELVGLMVPGGGGRAGGGDGGGALSCRGTWTADRQCGTETFVDGE